MKFLMTPVSAALPDSNARNICHKLVALENFSVSRELGKFFDSVSGSCKATKTAEGERET